MTLSFLQIVILVCLLVGYILTPSGYRQVNTPGVFLLNAFLGISLALVLVGFNLYFNHYSLERMGVGRGYFFEALQPSLVVLVILLSIALILIKVRGGKNIINPTHDLLNDALSCLGLRSAAVSLWGWF